MKKKVAIIGDAFLGIETEMLSKYDLRRLALIKKLTDKKSEENNTIDLEAYSLGLKDMFNELSVVTCTGCKNEINSELLDALQIYLNAGSKSQRKNASIIAKKAIEKALNV